MGKAAVNVAKIVDFIKSSKEPVDRKQILNATGYGGDFNYAMKLVVNGHDDIERIGDKSHAFYIYKPSKAIYSEMKNSEGYPDSTAGRAIAAVMKTENGGRFPMRQSFGEVWPLSTVKGCCEGLLVVSAKAGTCIGFNVYPEKQDFMKPEYIKSIIDPDGHVHYVYTLSPVNTYASNIPGKDPKFEISDEEKESLRDWVCEIFNIEPSIRTVEVEIKDTSLETEVAQLKASIARYQEQCDHLLEENAKLAETGKNIELAVLKAKCEIYEKIVFGEKR